MEDTSVEYMPQVVSMNRIGGSPLGEKHTIIMWDNIKSAGLVQYAYLLGVLDNAEGKPIFFVASEVNQMAALGGGSHCLGVFDGSGHANLGFSNDWGDPRKFFPEAVRIASERFGVPFEGEPVPQNTTPPASGVPKPPRKPWWRFWG